MPTRSSRSTGQPGLRAVAARAGVSMSTVSNVLNHPEVVAAATRERVEAAVREVGYVRNGIARQLRGVGSPVAACVLMDSRNPFFAELARGVEDRLVEDGRMLLVCNTDTNTAREVRYLHMLREQGVLGIVVSPMGPELDELVQVHAGGTPVVLVDHRRGDVDLCAAAVDHVRGGELVVTHLLSLGHRRLAFVRRGTADVQPVRDRLEGIHRGLRSAGLDPAAQLVVRTLPAAPSWESAEALLREVLSMSEAPTALACLNDDTAVQVLGAAHRLGIAVPERLSVIGYDDITAAAAVTPALTTVRRPIYELGRAAADLLIVEVQAGRGDEVAQGQGDRSGGRRGPGHVHQERMFTPSLVVRSSTAPPPGPAAEPSRSASENRGSDRPTR